MGRLTRKWQVSLADDHFDDLDGHQQIQGGIQPKPNDRTKLDSPMANGGSLYPRESIFADSRSYGVSTKPWGTKKALLNQGEPRVLLRHICSGFVDLGAVNFADFRPISIKGREPVLIYGAVTEAWSRTEAITA